MVKVQVTWEDAALKTGWQDPEVTIGWMTNNERHLVYTIGYVFAQGDDWMVLVDGHSEGMVCNPIRIPRSMIREILFLEDGDDEKVEPDKED